MPLVKQVRTDLSLPSYFHAECISNDCSAQTLALSFVIGMETLGIVSLLYYLIYAILDDVSVSFPC